MIVVCDTSPVNYLVLIDEIDLLPQLFTAVVLPAAVLAELQQPRTPPRVLERLSDLFMRRGVPDHIRSDNGSEFTAKRVREGLERVGVKTLSIEPGSPWEIGYVESFNGKLRDELLDREVFDTLLEAKVLLGRWRKAYNTVRPHSSLGYRPPGPGVALPAARLDLGAGPVGIVWPRAVPDRHGTLGLPFVGGVFIRRFGEPVSQFRGIRFAVVGNSFRGVGWLIPLFPV